MMKLTTKTQAFLSGILCIFLTACGGGGSDGSSSTAAPNAQGTSGQPVTTMPSTTATGSTPSGSIPGATGTTPTVTPLPAQPVDMPWKSLFSPGSNELVLTATDCTSEINDRNGGGDGFITRSNPIITTLTLSLGTSTFIAKVVAQGVTLPGEITLGEGTDSSYILSLPSGTRTVVRELGAGDNVDGVSRTLRLRDYSGDATKQRLIYVYETATFSLNLVCSDVTNPLLRSAVNLSFSERLASYMQNSTDNTVNSRALGCSVPAAPSFTYSLSNNGEAKFNGVILAADWLTGADNTKSTYRENIFFAIDGSSRSTIEMNNNNQEGVRIWTENPINRSFSHQCYPDQILDRQSKLNNTTKILL
jgi:hypothetical protein